jgi:predicted AAA+ superfamily ATPase
MMIERVAQKTLESLSRQFPVVIITGPRQSGKTTLAVSTFPGMDYCSLENLDMRLMASEDPRLFLNRFPAGAILDEVQNSPDLLSYMQELIDFDSSGRKWILTGSQRLGVLSGISQSLAGRAAYLELLPFSIDELAGSVKNWSLDKVLLTGLYPPVHDKKIDSGIWAQNYIRSYIERDIRSMINVRDLSIFQRFLGLCAARIGQLLNLSGLASDAGITHNTAKAWISLLEASYVVFSLQPHNSNFRKRLVKTPKLYFHDTSLLCSLLSIENEKTMNLSSMRGAVFENLVISELLKYRYNRGRRSNLFFWRDRSGHEVDIVIDRQDNLLAVEVKSGSVIRNEYLRGLKWFQDISRTETAKLVYGGDSSWEMNGVEILSWRDISALTIYGTLE